MNITPEDQKILDEAREATKHMKKPSCAGGCEEYGFDGPLACMQNQCGMNSDGQLVAMGQECNHNWKTDFSRDNYTIKVCTKCYELDQIFNN